MARIILAPAGSHGDVHPFVALGRGLKARGHEVHVVTFAPFEGLVRRAGLDHFAAVGTADDYHAITHNPDLWHPSRSMRVVYADRGRNTRFIREAYRHIADRYRPGETVLAAGILAFGARTAHDGLGVPYATAHLQPAALKSVERPSVYANLRMRPWWPRWLRRFLFWFGDVAVIDPMLRPTLNACRAELGLPPLGRRVFNRWLNSPQRVVGLFPDWYGSAPDWPKQTRTTGFLRYDQADLEPVPPAVDAFLAAGEPPVVFTFGSAMRLGAPYFRAAVDACRLLGRRGLLLAKGADQIPADLPPTILHADYAPFSGVFPRAAAVVHHGGIGTCAQGLAAGVPQLVMPLAFDQPDNAARLERLGVGRWLWPAQFTGPQVADALRDLLASQEVPVRCRELASKLAATDPLDESCRLIESLVGTDRRPVPDSPAPRGVVTGNNS